MRKISVAVVTINRKSMSLLLLFLITAAALVSLSLAQVQVVSCPNARPRCSASVPEGSWISNVKIRRLSNSSFTVVRTEWTLDPQLPASTRYLLAFRKISTDSLGNQSYSILPQSNQSPNGRTLLGGLETASTYEVMACRPTLNVTTDLPSADPFGFIPECGFCIICFQTGDPYFEFETTAVRRINATYLELICEVLSNLAQYSVGWSIEEENDEDGEEDVRTTLVDRALVDGKPVSISVLTLSSVTSTLIAPDIVLEQDIQCTASADVLSQSSESGAFEEEESSEAVHFPIWAILFMAVGGLLVITCLIVGVSVSCGILCACRRTRPRHFEGGSIKRKISGSNEYLDRKFGIKNIMLEETSLSGHDITEATLREALLDDLIIDNSFIQVTTTIGQGEYGIVYKGLLRKGIVEEVVAVKSLKGMFVGVNDIHIAMQEIIKMKNFKHPNVMSLIGVAISGGAPSIIMPYMARGSLLGYLRKDRVALLPGEDADITQTGAVQKLLMQICFQISKGMAYLASLRFVHRDLAARNCMIDGRGVIKVADFGLAEDVYMRNYFRQTSQDAPVKLPLKWMAPESIKLGIFSEKSDVWSYGVTCWEVFTAGEIPYPGVHAPEVMQLLDDGKHLTRPKNKACSDKMFALMESCWAYYPDERLDFIQLSSQLDTELSALADYVDLSMITVDSKDSYYY